MIENLQIKNNYNLLFYYIVTLSCKLIVLPKKSLQCLFEYVYTGYVQNPPAFKIHPFKTQSNLRTAYQSGKGWR